jgi:5-formyltetrahydrofolate cyclo-ligase
MEWKEEKKELRRWARSQAQSLEPAWRREADSAIRRHLLGMAELTAAETVLAFMPTALEPDLRPLLEELLRQGKSLALPRCLEKGTMEFYRVEKLELLVPGAYGILEPGDGCPPLPREKAGFALVPCAAADRRGGRLGHGGGYYDRFFEEIPETAAAVVCYGPLLLPSVPLEGHDVRFPAVVTEEGVWRDGLLTSL